MLTLSTYFDTVAGASVSVSDASVASASVENGLLKVRGLSKGQTSAVISAGNESRSFVITVRDDAPSGGWL